MKKNNRFITVYSEGSDISSRQSIIVDKETGVNYIVWKSGYAGGITPLLDKDGKPVITSVLPDEG